MALVEPTSGSVGYLNGILYISNMKICMFTRIARTNNHVDMKEVLVVPSRVEQVAYRFSLKTALEPIPVIKYLK